MGLFNWAVPLMGPYVNRWDHAGVAEIVDWVRPFVPKQGEVLDVGGGTGSLARRLAVALSAHVTVLDASPQMLARLPESDRVTAVEGVAESMPFEDDRFDAVIVTDAFHHFRDQHGAAREFSRVVRPGGGVLVIDLDPTGIIMRTIALGEKLLGEPGAFLTPNQMCAFMTEHGIGGTCERTRGAGYRFVGRVA